MLVGTVTDRTTGQPLTGVRVTFGNVHAKTDGEGRYRLSGVRPGAGLLKVESDDVPPQSLSVVVKTSGTTKRDVTACSTTLDYNCSPQQ
jgi:hypothetical protein